VSEPSTPHETEAVQPTGGWDDLARAARSQGSDDEGELLRELLVFVLDRSAYAIPVSRVREIVRLRNLTPVPRVPKEVRGVIALRGEVLQVVDLRMRLSLAVTDRTRSTRVIVLHGDDDRVAGVLVDAVREVMRVPEDDIRPATGREEDSVTDLFLHGDEFVSIMNLDRVLDLSALDPNVR
jgi:purine-binding chemotaxis protein CheW